jgi:hypothetical protein
VAHCTTNLQTQTPANQKIQFAAKPVGCGCAKAFSPTTSIEKTQNPSKQAQSTRIQVLYGFIMEPAFFSSNIYIKSTALKHSNKPIRR